MVELISTILGVAFCVVAVVVITADIRRAMHKARYDKYMRKHSTCLHEYEGKIFDERVCMYCGKVLR